MAEIFKFDTIEEVASKIQTDLNSNLANGGVLAIYAFNATGKTRLTNILRESEDVIENEIESNGKNEGIKVLCYNAFFEDMFKWDNENYIINFDPNSWFVSLIIDQGLENKIADNFKDKISSKIEPSFDFNEGKITFNFASGDDKSSLNIKISRGEESMLIWSIFYTILVDAIQELNTDISNRTTTIFNNLKYIIIDDPVSSVDDTKIISMTVNLTKTIKLYEKNPQVKFVITTHHALFYNVLLNSLKSFRKVNKFIAYGLSINEIAFKLSNFDDSPFSYHISVKEMIQDAIENDEIQKYHFNLFRNLLEKTSNFLGHSEWGECLDKDNREAFARIINLYSHSKLSDLESKELSSEDKNLLKIVFSNFIQDYNWKN